ncbi:MAG: hypothetical protein AAFU78_06855 [Cyanobacteria bacterium J06633_2]
MTRSLNEEHSFNVPEATVTLPWPEVIESNDKRHGDRPNRYSRINDGLTLFQRFTLVSHDI